MAKQRKMNTFEMKLIRAIMVPYSKFQASRFRKSGGRKMQQLQGRDICLVTMKGAKSGATRYVPLMYVPYKEGVILVASLGGAPKHPVWYHNLVAHPDIDVQVGERTLELHARRASADEKAEVWPVCCEHYPDYQVYQDRCSRDIPVFICEPRNA